MPTPTPWAPSPDQSAARWEGGPVTLERAIAIALTNNPDLAALRHQTRSAHARANGALAGLLPTLKASAGYDHSWDDRRLVAARYSGEAGVFTRDVFAADLIADQPIFAGGRLVNRLREAEWMARAAGHRLARTGQKQAFEVTDVFYRLLALRRVISFQESAMMTVTEHLERIDHLIEAGKMAAVDRLRMEVRLAEIETDLVESRTRQSVRRRVLANLLGIEDVKRSLRAEGTLDAVDRPVPASPRALVAALDRRDDYLALRAEVVAQEKRLAVAQGAHWPRIGLRASYGGRWAGEVADDTPSLPPTTATAAATAIWKDSLHSDPGRFEEVGGLGVHLDIPVFSGGGVSARVVEERERLAANRRRMRALELGVRLEIETARAQLESAGLRITVAGKAILQAEESLRIERAKHENGKGSATDVLDAQTALLEAQTGHARAVADQHIAWEQFRLAVGPGPVSPETEGDLPEQSPPPPLQDRRGDKPDAPAAETDSSERAAEPGTGDGP